MGVAYSYTVQISGTPAPSIAINGLPAWLTFDGADTISGTPSPADAGITATIDVIAANGAGADATESFTITVYTVGSIVRTSGEGQQGTVATTLTAPFVITVTDGGGLPLPGMSVDFAAVAGGGTLSDTQPQVTDANGQAQITLTLGPTPGANSVTASAAGFSGSPVTFTSTAYAALQITTTSLPIGPVNLPFSTFLNAAGGVGPYTWSLNASSAPLPAALALTASTGEISGTPAATGTTSLIVDVTDSIGNVDTAVLDLTIANPMILGVIGDSISDEYLQSVPLIPNWVERLNMDRGFDFGPFSATSRGEPRRAGFEYNWARSGATSDTAITDGQHTGLAAQVAAGNVNYVMMMIGNNDLSSLIPQVVTGTLTQADIDGLVANLQANLNTMIDSLQAAGTVNIMLATIIDWRHTPQVKSTVPLPSMLDQITSITVAVNDMIRALAVSRGLFLIDNYQFLEDIMALPSLVVGGLTIDRNTPGDLPVNFFLSDGIHPGAVASALLANEIMQAMNTYFATSLTALTDAEILAGL